MASKVRVFNAKLVEILELGIESKDPSRERLMRIPIDSLQVASFYAQLSEFPSLRAVIETDYFQMVSLILSKRDFDLFKSTVGIVSTSSVLEPIANGSKSVLEKLLYEWRGIRAIPQLGNQLDRLQFLIRYSATADYDSIPKLPLEVERVLGPPTSPDILDEFTRNAKSLYLNSLLLSAFFMVGVNIVMNSYENFEDAMSYMDELWHQTRPKDADGVILNRTPVPTDALWLTQYFLYGGSGTDLWYTNFHFRLFHGVERYVIEYFLLCLAKLGSTIPTPGDADIEALARQENTEPLEWMYRHAWLFLTTVQTQRFQSVLNDIGDRGYDEFVRRDKPTRPDSNWADELRGSVKSAIAGMNALLGLAKARLPLDESKVSRCKQTIKNAYLKETIVDDFAIPNTGPSAEISLVSFSTRFPPLDRDCFIRPSHSDCGIVWLDFGRSIAERESSYFVRTLSGGEPQTRILSRYDPQEIYSIILELSKNMSDTNHPPTGVLLPLKLEHDLTLLGKVDFQTGRHLRLHPGPVIMRTYRGEPTRAFLVNKNSCAWFFDSFEETRIGVDVRALTANPTVVEVEILSRGILKIDTAGIGELRFPAP